MEIEVAAVGRRAAKYIEEGLEMYLTRLKRYVPYKLTLIPDVKNAGRISEGEQKEAEGLAILQRIQPSDRVILLDERGKLYTSEEFAAHLEKLMATGLKRVMFVIGGPYGFSPAVYERADAMLSLSKMTFNHEMVRLFFTEQIYRAMTILRGEPYHHK